MNNDLKHETRVPDRPDWEKITPNHLLDAIKHMRESFDTEFWRCAEVTKQFCYASLHPNHTESGFLAGYSHALGKYLGLLTPGVQDEFERFLKLGTPSSLFRAYFDLCLRAMEENIQAQFNATLKIGLANWRVLNGHPVDWAKSHLILLINRKLPSVERWIKDVCDKQEVPEPEQIKAQFEEIVFWKRWRAPKFIYMHPAGNAPYHPAIAWDREDEHHTQDLVTARSRWFIELLSIALEHIAGSAHIEIAQDKEYAAILEDLAPKKASREGLPCPPLPGVPQSSKKYDALLPKYSSELKRGILMQLLANRSASDIDVCRALDANGDVELPATWRARQGDRLFAVAYKNPQFKRKIEIMISKIRTDQRPTLPTTLNTHIGQL